MAAHERLSDRQADARLRKKEGQTKSSEGCVFGMARKGKGGGV